MLNRCEATASFVATPAGETRDLRNVNPPVVVLWRLRVGNLLVSMFRLKQAAQSEQQDEEIVPPVTEGRSGAEMKGSFDRPTPLLPPASAPSTLGLSGYSQ